MNFCKSLCAALCLTFLSAVSAFSQEQQRPRVVKPIDSQPINAPQQMQRPPLTNKIVVVKPNPANNTIIKKTGSTQAINAPVNSTYNQNYYSPVFNQRLFAAIQARLGTPYRYGSTGPNTYDCSGLVWSVFNEAGFYFERSSARTLWNMSIPVEGDDRFKPGTLIFLNGLAHIGIVADDKGFYHASTSNGVMYSTFDGYWANRIVGFRRLPVAETRR